MQIQLNLNKKDLNVTSNQATASHNSSMKSPMFPDIKRARIYSNGPGPGKYARSSSVGHLNHDITLMRNPAYSIGKAVRMIDLNSNPFYGFHATSSNIEY